MERRQRIPVCFYSWLLSFSLPSSVRSGLMAESGRLMSYAVHCTLLWTWASVLLGTFPKFDCSPRPISIFLCSWKKAFELVYCTELVKSVDYVYFSAVLTVPGVIRDFCKHCYEIPKKLYGVGVRRRPRWLIFWQPCIIDQLLCWWSGSWSPPNRIEERC